MKKHLRNYVENVPQNSNFVHFKPQIKKKNGNPGTRVLKLKNLTRPKAKKPGYPGFQVPGFRTLPLNDGVYLSKLGGTYGRNITEILYKKVPSESNAITCLG